MDKEEEKNVEKHLYIPLELGKHSNLVTTHQEALESVRSRFVEGTQEEWVSLAVEAGLSQEEAEKLFGSLKGEKLFWFDRDGKSLWRWVNE
jgi:hypothetical protein